MNKQESQNQVSIIINGIRYDAMDGNSCTKCDLFEYCTSNFEPCNMFVPEMSIIKVFKKSDKNEQR